jgi:hypothetical protein
MAQLDSGRLSRIIETIMGILKHADEDRIAFDGKNVPTQRREDRGITTQPRCRIDHRPLDPANRTSQRMAAPTNRREFSPNALPRSIIDTADFKPENRRIQDQFLRDVVIIARHD